MPANAVAYTTGNVVDFFSRLPVKDAIVTVNKAAAVTDKNGIFLIKSNGYEISVRANGYLRATQTIKNHLLSVPVEIRLLPFTPKALYLTVYGIGSKAIRDSALRLIQDTELNALVIDVKGDRGFIPYKSNVPLALQIGGQKITTVRDMAGLMKSLKEKGVYTIARIVVFKDDLLAAAKPELAVKTQSSAVWRDREGLAWVDPLKKEVWDYNIDIAVEAAQYGFDEIQFDYVRFPDTPGLRFSKETTEENRVGAISGFLAEARNRLLPYNVFLGADVFGYVSWNLNDTKIGQRIEDLSAPLEYLCLMLYPSGFQYGIPGYRNPVANPYEIIYLTLKRAQERTNIPPIRFRPWLQAFRDYAFDKRDFQANEIRKQIDAAEKFGSDGWMLWNPQNNYTSAGLKKFNHQKFVTDEDSGQNK